MTYFLYWWHKTEDKLFDLVEYDSEGSALDMITELKNSYGDNVAYTLIFGEEISIN